MNFLILNLGRILSRHSYRFEFVVNLYTVEDEEEDLDEFEEHDEVVDEGGNRLVTQQHMVDLEQPPEYVLL